MTRSQRKVLLFLQDQQAKGRSVTVSEIAKAVGNWRSRVHACLSALVEQGYVTHQRKRAKSYEVIRKIEPIVEWRVYDRVTRTWTTVAKSKG